MLKKSDIWVLVGLVLLAFAAAAIQTRSPAPPEILRDYDIAIRATLINYMATIRTKTKTLKKNALPLQTQCYIAPNTIQGIENWQFEGRSRLIRRGGIRNRGVNKNRLQLLTLTTTKGRTLRLRFIMKKHESENQKIWRINSCAIIGELRDA